MDTILSIEDVLQLDFESISEDDFWNTGEMKELQIHKVHVYPAKFPSLIAQKSIEYALSLGIEIEKVADIFCGCGTVAVEACRKGYSFYGCDLNPVAVLLAKTKTTQYNSTEVLRIGNEIIDLYKQNSCNEMYKKANLRLQYWYNESQYNKLYHLKGIIDEYEMTEQYHMLFLCIFSSILKATSKWLTKSIKPQIDPQKENHDVIETFQKQLNVFVNAIELEDYANYENIEIENINVLDIEKTSYADVIITSPPYVTSYEYADLHQLSSLWLGYTEDYTELRKDSIGSQYGTSKDSEWKLNITEQSIVNSFPKNSQGRSIARYYSQMNDVVDICYKLLKPSGICVFVIGDTEYKNIKVENARCLAESMINSKFQIIDISKRKIANKFLPSHRDENGKFSSNKADRKIYSQEYIIIGRKI